MSDTPTFTKQVNPPPPPLTKADPKAWARELVEKLTAKRVSLPIDKRDGEHGRKLAKAIDALQSYVDGRPSPQADGEGLADQFAKRAGPLLKARIDEANRVRNERLQKMEKQVFDLATDVVELKAEINDNVQAIKAGIEKMLATTPQVSITRRPFDAEAYRRSVLEEVRRGR